ncbi:Putative enzyme of poly-gamma-glutamate biosynthesis [Elusimicrobium minutum Pei191]|uniref:Putative enzyme of poly-gamma-glutamate biosynthesis n=1 Tax=Elusimicrobium minutum (strain Pei191) TaxID=445932 RepID=B2KCR9_ELUMP|nr:CapA family protein [Elusimicrobium minutum]ACC98315.1 Putative enzyme of poly-gamma-glutamate biosynthesis [Elusimicrobium minutum Pei191]
MFFLVFIIFISACVERNKNDILIPPAAPVALQKDNITLTFAGDLMAHKSNTKIKDLSLIYKDVKEIFEEADLSFVNLETPIYEEKGYKGYPRFSIKKEYADAAQQAGLNVFSLANNHTNDQGEKGVEETYKYFAERKKDNIFSAGIRAKKEDGLSYSLIETGGWKILFAAVTEFSNTVDESKRVDIISSTPKGRRKFKETIIKLREDNPCDVFVLSMHTYEPEYDLEVKESRKTYFKELNKAGIDIVWGAHPHVFQGWDQTADKMAIYSLGNLISAQRFKLNYDNPGENKQYTGDSALLQIKLKKSKDGGVKIVNIFPYLITTHIDEDRNFVIRRLTSEFADEQNKKTMKYYLKRIELMNKRI